MEFLVVVAIGGLMLYFGILHDQETRQRYIREQQERRDRQILEWDYQLRLNPWLRDIYEGRVTQADIDAARKRNPVEEKPPVEWDIEVLVNLTNLREGTGFIDRERMLLSMARQMPERDDFYVLYMRDSNPFAQLGVAYHGVAIVPIFEIYAGNFDLYHLLGDMIEDICKQLGAKCSIKEYHGQPPNQGTNGPDWSTLQSDAPFYSNS